MTDLGTAADTDWVILKPMLRARDRLWCRAACEALGTVEIEALMHKFNKLQRDSCDLDTSGDGE